MRALNIEDSIHSGLRKFGGANIGLLLTPVNNCLSVHYGTKHDSAYCDLANQSEVRKTGQEFSAPYALTDEGRAALAEMTRRHAA